METNRMTSSESDISLEASPEQDVEKIPEDTAEKDIPGGLRSAVDFVIDAMLEDESLLNPMIALDLFLRLYEGDDVDLVEGFTNVVELERNPEIREENDEYSIRDNEQGGNVISSSSHWWLMHDGIIYDPFSEAIRIKNDTPDSVVLTYTNEPLTECEQNVALEELFSKLLKGASEVKSPNEVSRRCEFHPDIEEKLEILLEKYKEVDQCLD